MTWDKKLLIIDKYLLTIDSYSVKVRFKQGITGITNSAKML